MSDFWSSVISQSIAGLIGALAGAGASYCFYRLGECNRAKQEFASIVGPICDSVAEAANPAKVRAETMQTLIGPYHRFRVSLSRTDRDKIQATWRKYRDMSEEQLAPKPFDLKNGELQVPEDDGHKAVRQKIWSLLDELREFTK